MSSEYEVAAANKARVREAFGRLMNERDPDALDDIFHPDFIDHGAPAGLAPGIQGMREQIVQHFRIFEQLEAIIEDMIAEGDRIAIRWQMRAIVKETGQKLDWSTVGILRLQDGLIVERWARFQEPRLEH